MLSKHTKKEQSIQSQIAGLEQTLTMKSLLLVGVLILHQVLNIGLEETHGELTGENTDSSKSKCTKTILELKPIAQLLFHQLGNLTMTKISSFNDYQFSFNLPKYLSIITSISIY
jgi:hypothetical protein